MTDDGIIIIEYSAEPNRREGCGYLPAWWNNGRRHGSDWQPFGYAYDEALEMARAEAEEEAARYIGDWDVTVRERQVSEPTARAV